ncbi:MAG TPA: VOC family protein [Aquihabitans sp.]|jgi:catechol-2,3-dioxygenase|nr:VOC family protein [Aquihabitans sp.]
MGISNLNHAVLYVRDAERSAAFYRDVLGFTTAAEFPGGAFLRAPESTNDHDIAFFTIGAGAGPSQAGRSTVGLYHLAWEVRTLAELVEVEAALREAGALAGASDHTASKSLYAKDPDGLEFEVCWVVPVALLGDAATPTGIRPMPLDLDREVARFGAHTPGGTASPVAG